MGLAQGETEPIGRLLVDRGWITSAQLAAALIRQKELGGRLGTALLETGAVSENVLLKTLAEQTGLPMADIDELRSIPQAAIDMMPAKVAMRHKAIPFRCGRGRVDLAVLQEPDIPTLDELAFVVGRRTVIHIANEVRIHEALGRHYGAEFPLRFVQLLERLNRSRDHGAQEPAAAAAPSPAAEPSSPRRRPPAAATSAAPPAAAAARPPRPTSVPLSDDEKQSLRHAAESRDSIRPLSQDGVRQALQEARRADDIGGALLGHLGQEFLRLLMFRVGQGRVRGWMGRSPALDEYAFRNWTVGFDEASVFLNLRQGAEFFLGKLPAMPAHERLLKCWRGSLDTECAVFPVKVRDRLVCAIYGDRDSLGLAGLDVPAIQRLTGKAAIAFEMLLMQRKLRS